MEVIEVPGVNTEIIPLQSALTLLLPLLLVLVYTFSSRVLSISAHLLLSQPSSVALSASSPPPSVNNLPAPPPFTSAPFPRSYLTGLFPPFLCTLPSFHRLLLSPPFVSFLRLSSANMSRGKKERGGNARKG